MEEFPQTNNKNEGQEATPASKEKKPLMIFKEKLFWIGILIIIIAGAASYSASAVSVDSFRDQIINFWQQLENSLFMPAASPSQTQKPVEKYTSNISYEQAIIDTVKQASPSVVSIIISKNMPVYEQQWQNFPGFDFQLPQYVQKGTQQQEVGAGSGFIISEDGTIVTNKHVVVDKDAGYTVLTNDGKKYSAKVLALDPVQDIAVIKIQNPDKKFPIIKLGDSDGIEIGQGAVAIGNALGEFRNTVSVGIVSGLGRTISASGGQGFSETLEDVIQTDAAINPGNSGGPLLNLKGEVIGINVAMAQGAEAIGFAVPVNRAKKDIEQVLKNNKIIYPFLGVRYALVDETVKQKYNLPVDYGALVLKGSSGEPAVTAGSAADKAGIKENDVILEFGGKKITVDNSMQKIISNYNPGDKANLKILRSGKEIYIEVTLRERT